MHDGGPLTTDARSSEGGDVAVGDAVELSLHARDPAFGEPARDRRVRRRRRIGPLREGRTDDLQRPALPRRLEPGGLLDGECAVEDVVAAPPDRDRRRSWCGRIDRLPGFDALPRCCGVVLGRDDPERRHEVEAPRRPGLRQRFRPDGSRVRCEEHLVASPFELGKVGEVRSPGIWVGPQEVREPPPHAADVVVVRGKLRHVGLAEGRESLLPEEPGHVGEGRAQRLHQAGRVHAPVDRHPVGCRQLGGPGEAVLDGRRLHRAIPGHEPVEQGLGLGERHDALRRDGASVSASRIAARWLSATTSSSGGMRSSHSTSDGTRPKRWSASR